MEEWARSQSSIEPDAAGSAQQQALARVAAAAADVSGPGWVGGGCARVEEGRWVRHGGLLRREAPGRPSGSSWLALGSPAANTCCNQLGSPTLTRLGSSPLSRASSCTPSFSLWACSASWS